MLGIVTFNANESTIRYRGTVYFTSTVLYPLHPPLLLALQVQHIKDGTPHIYIPVELARACFPTVTAATPCEVQLAFTVDGAPATGEFTKESCAAYAWGCCTAHSRPAMLLQDWLCHTLPEWSLHAEVIKGYSRISANCQRSQQSCAGLQATPSTA